MKLWIDAARLNSERVFGMSMIERHLKAARHQKLELSEVIVDIGNATTEPGWADEKRLGCPVRIARGGGDTAERLLRALAGGEVLIVTDAATLADARLYRYLAGCTGSRAARENRAVIARIEPVDGARLLAAPTLDAAIAHL